MKVKLVNNISYHVLQRISLLGQIRASVGRLVFDWTDCINVAGVCLFMFYPKIGFMGIRCRQQLCQETTGEPGMTE